MEDAHANRRRLIAYTIILVNTEEERIQKRRDDNCELDTTRQIVYDESKHRTNKGKEDSIRDDK